MLNSATVMTSLERFVRDLFHSFRALRRVPSFTATITLTLAVGIGAATTIFSAMKGTLLEPLPYPEHDRLVELVHEAPGIGIDSLRASPAIYFAYRDYAETFDAVGLWDWDDSPVTVVIDGEPESVASVEVTHEVLPMLGAEPIRGRAFTAADTRAGGAPTVILSHDYWQRRFGGGDAIGRVLLVRGIPREVIGILPPSFEFFDYAADVYYPLTLDRAAATFPAFDGRGIARLKPGVTLEEANADAARIMPILWDEFGRPGTGFESADFRPRLVPLKESVVGSLDDTLWLLMGTIGMLLAIGCANAASLALVRAERRREEVAIRAALGAGRRDVARLVATETVLLCGAGTLLGLGAAALALPSLVSLFDAALPHIARVVVDLDVVLFAFGIAAVAAAVIAVPPMVRFAASKHADALHLGAGAVAGGRPTDWTRHALVVAQVALAVVLLVGSGLMVRTFVALSSVDPGFRDPDAVLTFQLTIPDPDESLTAMEIVQIQRAIAERLAAVPGVQSAAFAAFNDALPLDGDNRGGRISVEDGLRGDGERNVEIQFVSPGFFETLATPLVAGRGLDWSDVDASRRVVLVSESFARAEWGEVDAAIGRRVHVDGAWEVIGVLQDVHHDGLARAAPDSVVFPLIVTEGPPGIATATFVVRSARVGAPYFLDELRAAVRTVSSGLALAEPRTLGDLYRRSMARTSMALTLLVAAAAMAMLLGLIGIYGVMSYSVALRRREIAVRLALGGSPSRIRRALVGRALALTGIGVVSGSAVAAALSRAAESQLFGVSSLDPATYAAVAAALLIAAGTAAYVPARQASSMRPVEVLKAE